MKRSLILILLLIVVTGFRKHISNGAEWPKSWPEPHYNFREEGFTTAKAELGRALFFDPVLSADGSISCASCHSPYNAFSHTDHKLSHGIHDSIGFRNAPALMNLAWQSSFMWDGAIHHLDFQALAPMTSKAEMGETFPNVIRKINESSFYRSGFANAFGDSVISGAEILKSMGMFMASLISCQSKYDSVMQHTRSFTEQEAHGYTLFRQHCNSCHQEPLFTNGAFATNGLAADPVLNDSGRARITGNSADRYLFKVPTLRNIQFTGPYMHDGRFKTLRQVLNHYTSIVRTGELSLSEPQPEISLTADDQTDLIAFLLTLSDRSFLFDPSHTFPPALLSKTANK